MYNNSNSLLSALICSSLVVFLIVAGQPENGDNSYYVVDDSELDGAGKEERGVATSETGSGGGVTYIRWGRTRCDSHGATLLYSGHGAGKPYNEGGGGSNHLCLPEEPQWGQHVTDSKYFSLLSGLEYRIHDGQANLFSTVNNGGHSLHSHPAPCAVCYVPRRTASVMIPARTSCPVGWTREYGGYLMSEHAYDDTSGRPRHPTNYICVDQAPETAPGHVDVLQAMVIPVKVDCGTLPCSVYHDGWELTCVVCTK